MQLNRMNYECTHHDYQQHERVEKRNEQTLKFSSPVKSSRRRASLAHESSAGCVTPSMIRRGSALGPSAKNMHIHQDQHHLKRTDSFCVESRSSHRMNRLSDKEPTQHYFSPPRNRPKPQQPEYPLATKNQSTERLRTDPFPDERKRRNQKDFHDSTIAVVAEFRGVMDRSNRSNSKQKSKNFPSSDDSVATPWTSAPISFTTSMDTPSSIGSRSKMSHSKTSQSSPHTLTTTCSTGSPLSSRASGSHFPPRSYHSHGSKGSDQRHGTSATATSKWQMTHHPSPSTNHLRGDCTPRFVQRCPSMSASNHTNPRSTNTTSLHRISSSDHGRKSAEFDEVSFENLTFVDDYVACGVYEDRSRDNYHHEENHNDSDDDDDIDENYDTEEFFEEEDEVPELTELELLELAVQRGSGIAGLNYQTATKLASATQTITREAIAGKDVQPSLNKNRSPNKDRRPGQRVLSQRSSFSHRSQEEIEPRSNRARSNHEVGRYARPIAPLRIKSVRVNSETDDCEDDSGDYNGDYHQEFAEQDSGDLTADSFASLEHQSPRR